MSPVSRVALICALGVVLTAAWAPALAVTVNDSDGDGCSDGEEVGPSEAFGGRRDPEHFWDFFDTPDNANQRNQVIDLFGDIFSVAFRFGSNDDGGAAPINRNSDPLSPPPPLLAYHPAFDRESATPGSDLWDLLAADGTIDLFNDIFGVAFQFGHNCSGPEVLGTWTEGAPMPTARTEVTSAYLDGTIYVIGGFPAAGGHTDIVEAYDVAGDSWSTVAPLPQAIDHAGAATVGDKVYLVGGYISLGGAIVSDKTYEYDPVTGGWTEKASMPFGRAAAAIIVIDNIIYVAGGVGPNETVALAYDPALDQWSQLASIGDDREHLTASAVGGKMYLVAGRENTIFNVDTVEVYDPVADTWQTLTSIPTARGGLASGTIAGRVHVVGGENLAPGGSTFPQHEVYDAATDTWLPALPLPTPRHGLTAQVVDGKMYVIGGGPQPFLTVSDKVEIFELKP